MRVYLLEPGCDFEVKEVPNTPTGIQVVVDGAFGILPLGMKYMEQGIVAIANEDFASPEYELSMLLVDDLGCAQVGGTVFFCGLDGEEVADITDEQIEFINQNSRNDLLLKAKIVTL